MLRVVLLVLWICVTVYAIADWWRTPEDRCPGGIARVLWLLIILFTIPSFSIGSIAWVIMRAVARAEARQKGEPVEDPGLFSTVKERVAPTPPPAPTPLAPDDDPEFLFRLERDLARKRAEERAAEEKAERDRLAREREEQRASASPNSVAEGRIADSTAAGDSNEGEKDEGDAPKGPSSQDDTTPGPR